MSIDTVRSIYDAFSRGDVPAILERLSPDVDWEYGQTHNDVPWLAHRKGRAEVPGFFAALMENVELRRFAPKQFFEGPGVVVVLLDLEGVVRRTGQEIREEDEVHVWRFGPDGRVARFRHALDSARHQAAWRG